MQRRGTKIGLGIYGREEKPIVFHLFNASLGCLFKLVLVRVLYYTVQKFQFQNGAVKRDCYLHVE